jgi:hypothetical protein
MQLKKFVALGLTTLALAAPFASHAETDFPFNGEMHMKMADKAAMVSKADKAGMASMDKMQEPQKKLYTGGRN